MVKFSELKGFIDWLDQEAVPDKRASSWRLAKWFVLVELLSQKLSRTGRDRLSQQKVMEAAETATDLIQKIGAELPVIFAADSASGKKLVDALLELEAAIPQTIDWLGADDASVSSVQDRLAAAAAKASDACDAVSASLKPWLD